MVLAKQRERESEIEIKENGNFTYPSALYDGQSFLKASSVIQFEVLPSWHLFIVSNTHHFVPGPRVDVIRA